MAATLEHVDEWDDIINNIYKKSALQWRERFLRNYKTDRERAEALDKLAEQSAIEWKALMAKPMNYDINISKKDLERERANYEEALKPVGEETITHSDTDIYIDNSGRIRWNVNKWRGRHGRKFKYEDEITVEDYDFDDKSIYASNVLMRKIETDWLKRLFSKNPKETIYKVAKETASEWGAWLKNLGAKEKANWKSDLNAVWKRAEKDAKDAFFSTIGVGNFVQTYQHKRDSIRKDINDALRDIRNTYIDKLEGTVSDVIDNVKNMAGKYINGVKTRAVDYAVRKGQAVAGWLQQRFGGVMKRLAGVIPEPVARILAPAKAILGNTIGKIANKLGLGKFFGKGDGAGGVSEATDITIAGPFTDDVRSPLTISNPVDWSRYRVKKLTPTKQRSWEMEALITEGVDLRETLEVLVEDYGYVANILRSINYSRSYHFIQRPALASEDAMVYRSYAFFTRPNLNLFVDGHVNPYLRNYPEFYSLVMTDPALYSELCREGAYKSNLFKLLNNYVKEVSPVRLNETNREGILNMHGQGIPAPGTPEKYNQDVAVTFFDNSRGDIQNLFYAWSNYKELVSRQGFPMRAEYIRNKSLDYLTTLHVVVVDINWNVIRYGIGYAMFPPEPPTQATQHKLDGLTKLDILDEFQVVFKVASWYAHAPHMYDRFNMLSGFNPHAVVDTRGYKGTAIMATGRTSETIVSERSNQRKSVFDPQFRNRAGDDPGSEPHFQFPGLFELMAVSPGFYRMSDVTDSDGNTDSRLNIKFGFSS